MSDQRNYVPLAGPDPSEDEKRRARLALASLAVRSGAGVGDLRAALEALGLIKAAM